MLKPAVTFKELYLPRQALNRCTTPASSSLGEMNPVQLAKPEEKKLLQLSVSSQPPLLANRRLSQRQAPFIFIHRRGVLPTKLPVERVCACAQPQVGLQLPIFPIMDCLAARNRKI